MNFDPVLIAPRRKAMIAAGLWQDKTVNDHLDACLIGRPDQLAITAYQVESGTATRLTYRELGRMADRVAVGLTKLGVAKGDVVACQLPNWWQLPVIYLACARIGAVFNALMPIFRERELQFMLGHAEAKVFIVPDAFRKFAYEPMARDIQAALPTLKHVVIIGATQDGRPAANSFEALLSGPSWEDSPGAHDILTSHRPTGDDVMQLVYTSGTTGEPKCVMNTANTAFASISNYAERLHLDASDVIFMASPMAHQTGFLYGLNLPILLGARSVLQDIWEPKKAIELIRAEAVTYTTASTPFLTDLADAVEASGQPVPSLRTFLCGGAPVPGPLVDRAKRVLGTKIVSAWGMTEMGTATITRPEDDDERAINTDGCALPGNELKVVDGAGKILGTGQAGNLMTRSCSMMGGYLKRPHLNGVDAEGWIDTGDLAMLDERGYIRITGRSKDVIVRGGEKIPVVEVETLLYRHPAIAMAALVAYPDERMGERACAVVSVKPGASIDLASIAAFLKEQKITPQYIPERLVVLEQLPSTPTGKIQKHKLRDMLRAGEI